jgi:hypothetical protein
MVFSHLPAPSLGTGTGRGLRASRDPGGREAGRGSDQDAPDPPGLAPGTARPRPPVGRRTRLRPRPAGPGRRPRCRPRRVQPPPARPQRGRRGPAAGKGSTASTSRRSPRATPLIRRLQICWRNLRTLGWQGRSSIDHGRRGRRPADDEATSRALGRGIRVDQTDSTRVTSDLMTLAEAAALLRTPVATLRYWRYLGVGPAGFRLGRRVVFRRTDLDRWFASSRSARHVEGPRHLLMAHGDGRDRTAVKPFPEPVPPVGDPGPGIPTCAEPARTAAAPRPVDR